jgi:hypothetical protein
MANLKNLTPFKKGNNANPGGLPKEFRAITQSYKKWCFEQWQADKSIFRKAALENPIKFMQLLASFCPQEITGEDGAPITIKVVRYTDEVLSGDNTTVSL